MSFSSGSRPAAWLHRGCHLALYCHWGISACHWAYVACVHCPHPSPAQAASLRFGRDLRLLEVRRLLRSSAPVTLRMGSVPEPSDAGGLVAGGWEGGGRFLDGGQMPWQLGSGRAGLIALLPLGLRQKAFVTWPSRRFLHSGSHLTILHHTCPCAEGTAAQQIKLAVLAIRTCALPLGALGAPAAHVACRGLGVVSCAA